MRSEGPSSYSGDQTQIAKYSCTRERILLHFTSRGKSTLSSKRFHPVRVDHFKKWAERIIAAASTPDNADYLKSVKGMTTSRKPRRKRFRRKRKRKLKSNWRKYAR